MQDSVKIL